MTTGLKSKYTEKSPNANPENLQEKEESQPNFEEIKNPIPKIENLRRKKKAQNLSIRATIKRAERSEFIMSRTNDMDQEEFEYFENCKEKKLFNEKNIRIFTQFIKDNSCLNLIELPNFNEILQLISYLLNCLIKN